MEESIEVEVDSVDKICRVLRLRISAAKECAKRVDVVPRGLKLVQERIVVFLMSVKDCVWHAASRSQSFDGRFKSRAR